MRPQAAVLAIVLLSTLSLFQNCSVGGARKPNSKSSSSSAAASDACYNQFCATYYDEVDETGVSLERTEYLPIDYDWAGDSPDPALDVDTFSAYLHGSFDFDAGDVQFDATADDGIRIYVDGELIIDAYYDQGPTDYSAVKTMTAGRHTIEIHYYENGGGATLKFGYTPL